MLANVITADLVKGVMDEFLIVVPVGLGVLVGFAGVRKAISFIRGILNRA